MHVLRSWVLRITARQIAKREWMYNCSTRITPILHVSICMTILHQVPIFKLTPLTTAGSFTLATYI
jgi:hypothetical protein